MSKLITVFGATGNQGGSVVDIYLANSQLHETYKVRAVTRDPSKPAAKALSSKGIEVVGGDMTDSKSIEKAVAGSYGVFVLTNYWEVGSKDKEVAQGKAVADASKAAGVKHIVWSSLPNTTKLTGGKLDKIDHFVGKAEVEEYIESIKGSEMISTHYMPGFFMSNYKDFIHKGEDGVPVFANNLKPDTPMPLIDIRRDTGKYVWGAFEAGSSANGKQIQAVSEWSTPAKDMATISKAAGTEVKLVELPRDVVVSFMTKQFGGSDYLGEEMAQNLDLMKDYHYFGKDKKNEQAEHDKILLKGTKLTTFEEFVQSNGPWKW